MPFRHARARLSDCLSIIEHGRILSPLRLPIALHRLAFNNGREALPGDRLDAGWSRAGVYTCAAAEASDGMAGAATRCFCIAS
jgi:hypothetical protein